MAQTAAAASKPATKSFGLCSRTRSTNPRSSCGSIATALAPRRRRGMSSSSSIRLGTFLHLMGLVLVSGSQRRFERCDIAGRIRHEVQRQGHGYRGALADLALHVDLAVMQTDQTLYDRQAETGAFVLALIGLAGLEEGIADPLEVVGGDANPGVGHAQDQPRSFDRSRDHNVAAALGEFHSVGDEVEHDLLERARI